MPESHTTNEQREIEIEKKDRLLDEFNGNWELWIDPVAIMDEIDRLRITLATAETDRDQYKAMANGQR